MKSPSIHPDLDHLIVLQLWGLLTQFESRLESELQSLGLTVSRFRMIGEIMREPEGIRQGELARRLGVRPPTVSASIARLEEAGLLYRVQDPEDPRARRVHLSESASLSPGLDVFNRMESSLIDGLSREQLIQIREALGLLGVRLQNPPESGE
jgi:MarR family transcriptional regulator, organic hydroperoxide resistance regulator